jgi:hypothetical protein
MFEHWDEVELDLRVEATLQLDAGSLPVPQLVAFGDEGFVAEVRLRPFDAAGLLSALVEVLALLLPLGARRLALGLPGEVRETPEAPAADQGAGLETDADAVPDTDPDAVPDAVLVVATARTMPEGRTDLAGRVLALAFDGDCWQWRDDLAVDLDVDEWEVTRALAILLAAHEGDSGGPADDEEQHTLQAQLGRCLLLGHEIRLDPTIADLLEPGRLDLAPAPPGAIGP